MRRFLFAGLVFLFVTVEVVPQVKSYSVIPDSIRKFADYLFARGEYRFAAFEYERYLFLAGQNDPGVEFRIGVCFLRQHQFSRAKDIFLKLARVSRKTDYIDYLVYSSFRAGDYDLIDSLSGVSDVVLYFKYFSNLRKNFNGNYRKYLTSVNDNELREELLLLDKKRKKLRFKSPVKAALLSFFVPGLGKAYIGRSGDAFYSFATIGLLALVSKRAYDCGRYFTAVVTGGMSVSFYLGNIYGSYVGAGLYNEDLKNAWFKELEKLTPLKLDVAVR